ncbi:MAG: peptidoglycan DD-metalloendopeptidase family protein [Paenisporosarcina sp.]
MNLKWNTGNRTRISSVPLPYRTSNVMKKAVVTALLVSSFTFNIGFAKDNESGSLQKIYHIYASGQYVGAVADETAVNELIKTKINQASSQYKELTLGDGSDISIISEQVFTKETDDEKTLDKLNELVTVAAEAFALSVNDEIAVYVKDLDSYHEVIRKLKLKSVSEAELNELEARKDSIDTLPPLKENETRILDVNLKERISGVTKLAKPTAVLSVDEAVSYLQKGTLEEKTYKVQAGDVFSVIANKHNLSSSDLFKLNPGVNEDSVLQIGQELKVTALKPLVNVDVLSEKRVTETIKFKNEVEETDEMYKGDTKVKQKGIDGTKEMTYLIHEQNGEGISKSVKEEKVIVEAKNQIVLKGTKVIPSRGSGSFSWPAEGGYISSEMGHRWGAFHKGIDIARPSGFAIKAADNGIVTFAGRDGTYGNKVVVDHRNGYQTIYAHLSSINVNEGETVPQGTKLGVMGSTGRSTGVHLHFEVIKNGTNVNPLGYIGK